MYRHTVRAAPCTGVNDDLRRRLHQQRGGDVGRDLSNSSDSLLNPSHQEYWDRIPACTPIQFDMALWQSALLPGPGARLLHFLPSPAFYDREIGKPNCSRRSLPPALSSRQREVEEGGG